MQTAILFGSRAKGTHTERSDVDLVLSGDVTSLRAESIAAELDELPLPYRFDVQPLAEIMHRELLDHIARVGITICGPNAADDSDAATSPAASSPAPASS